MNCTHTTCTTQHYQHHSSVNCEHTWIVTGLMGHCGEKMHLKYHWHCTLTEFAMWNLLLTEPELENFIFQGRETDERRPYWWCSLMRNHPDETLTGCPDEPTLMRNHSDDRLPWWVTLISPHRWDHSGNTTLMSPPWWQAAMMRPPWWETTLCPPWWHAALKPPNNRPPSCEASLMRPPRWQATLIRPPWWDHPHDRQESKIIRYSKCRSYQMY